MFFISRCDHVFNIYSISLIRISDFKSYSTPAIISKSQTQKRILPQPESRIFVGFYKEKHAFREPQKKINQIFIVDFMKKITF